MKCLSAVALFGLIAIVSAGTKRLDEVNHHLLHRIVRQAQFASTSSSSSSSSSAAQPGQPIVFHQTSSSFNSFAPGGTASNSGPNVVPNLADRFGPEDGADNSSTASNSQSDNAQSNNQQTGNAQSGNIPFGGIPYGSNPYANGPYGNGQFGGAPFGNVPNYGNVPIFSGGHFSSVAGQYDPNTQQTVIYHNYNQKLK